MRKIELDMVHAIRKGRDWKRDNTAVEVNKEGEVEVRLFGNHIATIKNTNPRILTLHTRGKNTRTTSSRLDAITLFFTGTWRVCIRRGEIKLTKSYSTTPANDIPFRDITLKEISKISCRWEPIECLPK